MSIVRQKTRKLEEIACWRGQQVVLGGEMRDRFVKIGSLCGSSPFAPDRRRKRKLHKCSCCWATASGTRGSLHIFYSAGAMLMQNNKNQTTACEAENQSPGLLQCNAIYTKNVYEENYPVRCSRF